MSLKDIETKFEKISEFAHINIKYEISKAKSDCVYKVVKRTAGDYPFYESYGLNGIQLMSEEKYKILIEQLMKDGFEQKIIVSAI